MPALSLLTMCDTVAPLPSSLPQCYLLWVLFCIRLSLRSILWHSQASQTTPATSMALAFHHSDSQDIIWPSIPPPASSADLSGSPPHLLEKYLSRSVRLSIFLLVGWCQLSKYICIYLKKISKFPLIPLILPTSSSKVKGILFTPKPGVSEYFIKQFLLSHAVRPLKLL